MNKIITDEQAKALAHAVKVARYKGMKLTIGNVITLVEPEMRSALYRACRGILSMPITETEFERVLPEAHKKKRSKTAKEKP